MADCSQLLSCLNALSKVEVTSTANLLKSLRFLSKYATTSAGVEDIVLNEGVQILIELFRKGCDEVKNVTLSVMGNCAFLSSIWRRKFYCSGGLGLVVKDLSAADGGASSKSKIVRLLGNLCKSSHALHIVQDKFTIHSILGAVTLVNNDSTYIVSCLRVLRVICSTKQCATFAVECGEFGEILKALAADKPELVMLCVRLVGELLKTGSHLVCLRLLECECFERLVELAHWNNPQLHKLVMQVLFMLTTNASVRVHLATSGAIEVFVREIQCMELSGSFKYAIQSLCLCSREAVSRNRIKTVGALTDFSKVLSDERFVEFHESIVSSLVWYLFDDSSLALLIRANVIPALLKFLNRLTAVEVVMYEGNRGRRVLRSQHTAPSLRSDSDGTGQGGTLDSDVDALQQHISDAESHLTTDGSPGISSSVSYAEPCQYSPSYSSPDTSPYNASSPQYSLPSASPHMSPSFSPPRSPSGYESASPHYAGSMSPCSGSMSPCSGNSSPYSVRPQSPLLAGSGPHSPAVRDCGFDLSRSSSSKEVPYHHQSADGVHAMIHGTRGPVHDTLLLLSRFSQAKDPSSFFLNIDSVNSLMNYILLSNDANPKCARVLNRLTLNSHCFEVLLRKNLVPRLFLRLQCGWLLEEVAALHEGGLESRKMVEGELIAGDDHCPAVASPRESVLGIADHEATQNRRDFPNNSGQGVDTADAGMDARSASDAAYASSIQDVLRVIATHRQPSQSVLSLGSLLMSNLRSKTESSYGRGVLTHILLTGSSALKETCALSMPYLCWSAKLEQRLFLELKGLDILFAILGSALDESERFVMAVEAVCVLARLVGIAVDRSSSRFSISASSFFPAKDDDDIAPLSKKRRIENYSDGKQSLSGTSQSCGFSGKSGSDFDMRFITVSSTLGTGMELFIDRPSLQAGTLRHPNCPPSAVGKSVTFLLPSGRVISAPERQLVKHSPVFERMLSRYYNDASKPFIVIEDVDEGAFLLLLHYMSNCVICLGEGTCLECRFDGASFYPDASVRSSLQSTAVHSALSSCVQRVCNSSSVSNSACPLRLSTSTELLRSLGFQRCQKASVHLVSSQGVYKDQTAGSACKSGGSDPPDIGDATMLVASLLMCSDRFFVSELASHCEQFLMASISSDNVVQLYLIGSFLSSRALCRHAASYLLVSVPCPVQRAQFFTEILATEDRTSFLACVKDMLVQQLNRLDRKPA